MDFYLLAIVRVTPQKTHCSYGMSRCVQLRAAKMLNSSRRFLIFTHRKHKFFMYAASVNPRYHEFCNPFIFSVEVVHRWNKISNDTLFCSHMSGFMSHDPTGSDAMCIPCDINPEMFEQINVLLDILYQRWTTSTENKKGLQNSWQRGLTEAAYIRNLCLR